MMNGDPARLTGASGDDGLTADRIRGLALAAKSGGGAGGFEF